MDTQYQDGRFKAKIEEWTPSAGQQIGLGQSHGMVVRVYDHGPADGTDGPPRMILDSEMKHGSAGVFGDSAEARDYADRIEIATLVSARWSETIIHERREACPRRQSEHWAKRDQAKAEAAEANKRAKQHQQDAERLAAEAEAPGVIADVPLRGEGWAIKLSPSLTDGTHETEEWRVLVQQGPDPRPTTRDRRRHGPAVAKAEPSTLVDDVTDETLAKPRGLDPAAAREAYGEDQPKGKRTRKPKPAATLPPPDHVADSAGLPLKKGSRVAFDVMNDGGRYETIAGTVTQILGLDPSGVHRVEIEGERGEPYEALATECTRVPDPDEPTEDWTDPEAA